MRSKIIFGLTISLCVVASWLAGLAYAALLSAYEHSASLTDIEYSWFFKLLLNLAGYSTILVPGFILYKYIEKTNYFDNITNPTCVSRVLFALFGPYERVAAERAGERGAERGGARELAFCATGLMGAYLVWGLLQEKIMTQKYVLWDGSEVRFADSQFLVLLNRLAGLALAAARLRWTRTPLLAAPLHHFSYCALTNVLSAWCQYEALKYVSFPTQVLSKSCKVIPVMVMGTLVSRNKYLMYEYLTAALISLGMVMFIFGAHEAGGAGAGAGGAVGAGGAALLALYLCCDAFTSSWQAALFARYSLHPLQMLLAVNICSVALTGAALAHSGTTLASLSLLRHGPFLADCALLSVSSTVGQLLIYRTIASFGAVVFAIIMTLRQAVSILLSCVVYGHAVSASGAAGVSVVFGAVLGRMYCAHRRRALRAKHAPHAPHAPH